MLAHATLFLVVLVRLTSVSAQGIAFPTTLETVVRQNPTVISASRDNNVDPSAVIPDSGALLSAIEQDLNTITIIKTTYTGPWTKRNEEDSTALVNPGGPMVLATPTRETIVASPTKKPLQPTACPHHNLLCRVGQQPMFNQVNGSCECGPIPIVSQIS